MNLSTAIEAEATGQQHLVADYREHEYKVPADLDDWPLLHIERCVGRYGGDELRVDYDMLTATLALLLGDQWPDFLAAHPCRGELVPAANVFAAAAGVEAAEGDLVFGALPRLLAMLELWPAAVEATLGELGLDYRDRWRFDTDGRRRLTLRRIHTRLRYAAPDSPLGIEVNGGKRPHNGTELLLMDVFEAVSRVRHPSRPMSAEAMASRVAKDTEIEAERAAYRERHAKPPNRLQVARDIARANAKGNLA